MNILNQLIELTIKRDIENIKRCLLSVQGDKLKGDIFEEYIAELYRGNGYIAKVNKEKIHRSDGGADVLVSHPDKPLKVVKVLQTKNWSTPVNSRTAINEYYKFLREASKSYDCTQYELISVSGFSGENYIRDAEPGLVYRDIYSIEWLINGYKADKAQRPRPRVNLMPHNATAYDRVCRMWKKKNRAAVIQATGTGKTYIMLQALSDFQEGNKLVVTSSNEIIRQMKKQGTFIDNTTTFISYSKLCRLKKDSIEKMNLSLIVIDEFHRGGAKIWGKGLQRILKMYPEAKVLGTTATPIRYLENNRDMCLELFGGNIASELSLSGAILKSILPTPIYVSAYYSIEEELRRLGIQNNESRDLMVEWESSKGAAEIIKKHFHKKGGKFIVFCKDIASIDEMQPIVLKWFKKAGYRDVKLNSVYSEKGRKKVNNKKELDEFLGRESRATVSLLFSVNKLNEGVHVPDIDGVILLRETSSPNIYFQQIGRALSVSNTRQPIIFDFVNNHDCIAIGLLRSELKRELSKINKARKESGLDDLQVKNIELYDYTLEAEKILGRLAYKRDEKWLESYEEYKKAMEALSYLYDKNNSVLALEDADIIKKERKNGELPSEIKFAYVRSWIRKVRAMKQKNKLSDGKIKILDSEDFIWDIDSFRWNFYMDCIKRSLSENYKILYNTVGLEDWLLTDKKLTVKQVKELEDSGYCGDYIDYSIRIFINHALRLKDEKGEIFTASQVEKETEFEKWLKYISEYDRKTGRQIFYEFMIRKYHELKELQFLEDYKHLSWLYNFNMLKETLKYYGQSYKDCSFIEDDFTRLITDRMRNSYRYYDERKKKLLDTIGFPINYREYLKKHEMIIKK